MGIIYKVGLIAKAQLGLTQNLNALVKKVNALRVNTFHECISIGMFRAEYLPYEASKTYRKAKAEFEQQRSKAIVEAHTQTYRF